MSKVVAEYIKDDKRYELHEYPLEPDSQDTGVAKGKQKCPEEDLPDFWTWAPRGPDGEILPIADEDLPDKFRWRPRYSLPTSHAPDLQFGLFISVPGGDLVARSEEVRKASDNKEFRPTYVILLEHALRHLHPKEYLKPLVRPFPPYNWPKSWGVQDHSMQMLVFYYNDEPQQLRRWFQGERRLPVIVQELKAGFGLPEDAQPMWYVV